MLGAVSTSRETPIRPFPKQKTQGARWRARKWFVLPVVREAVTVLLTSLPQIFLHRNGSSMANMMTPRDAVSSSMMRLCQLLSN